MPLLHLRLISKIYIELVGYLDSRFIFKSEAGGEYNGVAEYSSFNSIIAFHPPSSGVCLVLNSWRSMPVNTW